jgi:predicted RNA binding protein YcfA (HicA-like mRNA interferase family)
MTGAEVVKKLQQAGWVLARINGSHHVMRRAGFPPVSVPVHGKRDLPPGTLGNIRRTTGETL